MIDHALKYLFLHPLLKPAMPLGGWYLRKSPQMITCREFNDFIYDYVDDNLTEKQTTLFKRHMRICPICRNFLETYIAAYKAERHTFPYDNIIVPDTVPQDLIDAILDVKQSQNHEFS